MVLIDNISRLLGDDLKQILRLGARLKAPLRATATGNTGQTGGACRTGTSQAARAGQDHGAAGQEKAIQSQGGNQCRTAEAENRNEGVKVTKN